MTYTPDQWQEAIVGLANAGAGGTPADTYQNGNLTAAQPVVGTPVVGGTVTIALGEGQAVVEAALTGTFSAGTTVLFEGTEDVGVTSNWFPTFGQDTSVSNPPNISSIVGGASKLVRIPSMGYAQVRVRANPFAGGDNVAVRMGASVAGSGMAGALSTNDGTFAKETGGNLATLVTNTADLLADGDFLTTIASNTTGAATSAKQDTGNTSLASIKTDADSIVTNTNKLIAPSVNSGTIDATTQRTVAGGAATGTKSSVASSGSSVTILASNTSRKGAIIYNDSTQILYLDLSGGTASSTSYSVQLVANAYFELPGPNLYNGAITGIWAAANGNARVTEWT